MSIFQPIGKEKEQKWKANYFLLSKFHFHSHSITEELVTWLHPTAKEAGKYTFRLGGTCPAKTQLPKNMGERDLGAQLATCQKWKRKFVSLCNQKIQDFRSSLTQDFKQCHQDWVALSPSLGPGSSVLTLCSNISVLGIVKAASQAHIQWERSFPLPSNPQIPRFLPLGVAHHLLTLTQSLWPETPTMLLFFWVKWVRTLKLCSNKKSSWLIAFLFLMYVGEGRCDDPLLV